MKFKIERADAPDCNLRPERRFVRLIRRVSLTMAMICVVLSLQAQSLSYRDAVWQNPKPKTSAEMGFMVGAGYMFSSPRVEEVVLNPKLGIRGALAMSLCWSGSYALQLELAYAYNKIEAQRGNGAEYDVKAGVMEIPIIFSYRGLWPMRFNAGAVLSVAGSGRYDLATERIEFGRLRPTLGYTAGIGVNLTRNLLLDARYTGSFVDTSNYFEGDVFSMRSHWLTLSIGYMF